MRRFNVNLPPEQLLSYSLDAFHNLVDNAGPNPTEYLLAAIGGCLTVNWGRLIKKMHLDIKELRIEVKGWRSLDEPQLKEIAYKITLVTNEEKKKLLKVKELAEKYGTVFNTMGAEKIKGEVEIE